MRGLLILAAMFISFEAVAGWFTKDEAPKPPKEFLNLEVCGGYSPGKCTIEEFVATAFPQEQRNIRWDKINDEEWVYKADSYDKAAETSTALAFVFRKKEKYGEIVRVLGEGQEFPQIMRTNLVIGLIEGLNKRKK